MLKRPTLPKTYLSLLVIATTLGVLGYPTIAFAQTLVVQPTDIGIDTTLVQEDRSYSIPKRIIVSPIFIPEEVAMVEDEEWYKGLFYYLVGGSGRSGFTDIPFHYVVTHRGRVYSGNSGGEERKISITGEGDDAIVIAYLAPGSARTFDIRSQEALADLLLEVVNRQAIEPQQISVKSVKFVRDSAQQNVRLEAQDVFGLWSQDLSSIREAVVKNYDPQPKEYKLEIKQVNLPESTVDSGTMVEASVLISNTGEHGVYFGTQTEIIATKKDEGTSKFYINNEWLSPGQFGLMDEDDVLLPGEDVEFTFNLGTPLYFGEQKEVFRIEDITGQKIEGSDFEISLNIKRPEGTIVEILPTSTGWLRLRSTPNGVENNEIGRVSSGERFYQTENAGNGWIKIRLNDGTEGWISRLYVKYI